ncbi:hypothetical protein HMPREF1569_0401 [Klebsiella oxytoca OK-1]|nr:hypothetical protein HMPREF1569_0401 [Klebsiella oxytoca OK-1]
MINKLILCNYEFFAFVYFFNLQGKFIITPNIITINECNYWLSTNIDSRISTICSTDVLFIVDNRNSIII